MSLIVRYIEGKKFQIECRSHKILVDQTERNGGMDEGMDPIELFNAGLASCAAFYAITFLNRHIGNLKGMEVESTWKFLEKPHRIGKISLIIRIPKTLKDTEKKALLRSVKLCTVKNTLDHQPIIDIYLKNPQETP
jgi:uncharacterized OsmC-like protein